MINYGKCFERYTQGVETENSREQTPLVTLVKEYLSEEKPAYKEWREKYSEIRGSMCKGPGVVKKQRKVCMTGT